MHIHPMCSHILSHMRSDGLETRHSVSPGNRKLVSICSGLVLPRGSTLRPEVLSTASTQF